MSGTKQTEFTLSGQSTDFSDPDAVKMYTQRILEPVFKKVRNTVNQLARDTLAISASGKVDAKYGLVLVDASHGPVTLTLVPPDQSFHPITVVKTDSSSNAVVAQVRGGALISGSVTDTFSKQWEVVQYESDDFKYVRTFGGNMSLFGDVTGRADSNTVSALQGITLTASGGSAPTTGQVLMYNGTVWLPVSRNIKALDNTYSPVGNWSFDIAPGSTVSDLSGNGCTLSVETGTMRTTNIHPTFGGVYFDGATNLRNATPQPQLQLLSAMTLLIMGLWADLPAALTTWVSYGIAGETEDTNVLYMAQFDNNSQFQYFSEHGAGVNDAANTLSTAGRYQPFLLCMTRDSGGVLRHGLNGVFSGSSFGTVTLPTGGTSGIIRVGADNGGGNFLKGIFGQLLIYNSAMSDAQFKERYNSSLGGAFGLK